MDPALEALGFAIGVGFDTAEDELHDGSETAADLGTHLGDLAKLYQDYVEGSEHEGTEPTLKDFFLYAHHVI